jgi:hypothetical protein
MRVAAMHLTQERSRRQSMSLHQKMHTTDPGRPLMSAVRPSWTTPRQTTVVRLCSIMRRRRGSHVSESTQRPAREGEVAEAD